MPSPQRAGSGILADACYISDGLRLPLGQDAWWHQRRRRHLHVAYRLPQPRYQFDNRPASCAVVACHPTRSPWFWHRRPPHPVFPEQSLKIEPDHQWLAVGWLVFNNSLGFGDDPVSGLNTSFQLVFNNYYGKDTLGVPDRKRVHTDDRYQEVAGQQHRHGTLTRRRSRSRSTPAASPAAASPAAMATRRRPRRISSAS